MAWRQARGQAKRASRGRACCDEDGDGRGEGASAAEGWAGGDRKGFEPPMARIGEGKNATKFRYSLID
jgi:hypothetical protein